MSLGKVTLRVIALVFMFVARTRFPVKHSIVNILRKRYGKILVKNVRKFEKYDFKYKKAILDLDFLLTCKEKNIIPKFLRFKVPNRQLQFSNTYNICVKRLLNQEISNKRKLVRTAKQNLTSMKDVLHREMCFIDFVHVTTIFLVSKDKAISKIQKTHGKKLHNLFLNNYYDNSITSYDVDQVIFNFSSHVLTNHEKSLLSKGLNFAISPKDINHADYLLPFELLYRDTNSLRISNFDLDSIKARLRDSAYKETSKFMEKNLPKAEFDALKSLIRNKELIIQKADKGNTVVFLNRKDYISKMKLILADTSKFKKIQIDDSKVLNHLIHMENKIVELLKRLKEKQEISDKVHNELYPTGSKPDILYGLCKIHKSIVDGVTPFRPILSAIGTPTSKLAKCFVPLLEPLTCNQYTIKVSFSFFEELKHFNTNLIMASFDVE